MKGRYVVDTNVLIAASAADPISPKDIDATPEDPALRIQVWEWLCEFEKSTSNMILDYKGRIRYEYEHSRHLDESSYGLQVFLHKWDQAAIDFVTVEYDADGHGILPDSLSIVHDLADRKMVAAALAAHKDLGEGCVAFAGDTDWHDWEEVLISHNVLLEPIIEQWSRQKHKEKQQR